MLVNVHSIYGFFWKLFRKRRISYFFSLFDICTETTVLDVGGTSYFWELGERMGLRVPKVTIINLGDRPAALPPKYAYVKGDGREMPFGDKKFDLVFSNSVIEHVAGKDDRQMFANEIRRVGRGYFVQTPDVRFPVEPHLLTPFIHWLPESVMTKMNPRFTIRGMFGGLTEQEVKELKSVRLLSVNEMVSYFSDAEAVVEKFMGMPKSIIAVRKA